MHFSFSSTLLAFSIANNTNYSQIAIFDANYYENDSTMPFFWSICLIMLSNIFTLSTYCSPSFPNFFRMLNRNMPAACLKRFWVSPKADIRTSTSS